jgi:hypothetical protein
MPEKWFLIKIMIALALFSSRMWVAGVSRFISSDCFIDFMKKKLFSALIHIKNFCLKISA